MSTQPTVVVDGQSQATSDPRQEARARAAACRARLTLASDALAAADLLLRLNWSVGQCGQEEK